MPVARAYGITMDALGGDPLTAAALEGVIDAQHRRPARGEGLYQVAQQKARRRGRGLGAPDPATKSDARPVRGLVRRCTAARDRSCSGSVSQWPVSRAASPWTSASCLARRQVRQHNSGCGRIMMPFEHWFSASRSGRPWSERAGAGRLSSGLVADGGSYRSCYVPRGNGVPVRPT